jgi:hypothetical protein
VNAAQKLAILVPMMSALTTLGRQPATLFEGGIDFDMWLKPDGGKDIFTIP